MALQPPPRLKSEHSVRRGPVPPAEAGLALVVIDLGHYSSDAKYRMRTHRRVRAWQRRPRVAIDLVVLGGSPTEQLELVERVRTSVGVASRASPSSTAPPYPRCAR
jgi:hypothetical protein